MTAKVFELSTSIGRLADLDEDWLQHYDAVYLGEPFCPYLKDNLLFSADDLVQAINIVRSAGKKAYVSSLAKPSIDGLSRVKKSIALAIKNGINAIEVFEPGTMRMVSMDFPEADMHVNGFMNLFNSSSVNVLRKFNIKRVFPSHELNFNEIAEISENTSIDIGLQISGKIPLGYAEGCVLRENYLDPAPCEGNCYEGNYFEYDNKNMLSGGFVPWSGKDVCLINSLTKLAGEGYRLFRAEARLESKLYRTETGLLYSAILDQLKNTGNITNVEEKIKLMEKLSPKGLCNGYFFGTAGVVFCSHEKQS